MPIQCLGQREAQTDKKSSIPNTVSSRSKLFASQIGCMCWPPFVRIHWQGPHGIALVISESRASIKAHCPLAGYMTASPIALWVASLGHLQRRPRGPDLVSDVQQGVHRHHALAQPEEVPRSNHRDRCSGPVAARAVP
jgi:hypothetical protein